LRLGVCLHAGAVVRSALPLHPSDRRALALSLATGAEVVVVEAVGRRGSAPTAISAALDAGAGQAWRLVDTALQRADAQATGFALASALDRLEVDLILFGDDADPDGIGDVPACIAHQMGALYVTGATELKVRGTTTPATGLGTDLPGADRGASRAAETCVDLTIETNLGVHRLGPLTNAVVGVAPDGAWPGVPTREEHERPSHERPGRPPVQVISLDDLSIDPARVRRRQDGRGVIEPSSRVLVTLQSALAVIGLLRR